ncbi:glycerol-3-phosphate phosphatase-like [Haliotis rubra]|uniref:glycerol-3-phosphate phosphatase-like n=1 Tax=Haliotis rubra TaxID=36100 RepID=UPI001EE57767|nr:glycerol-3-phosphate phosphatase-like [Haliotis rubra]
MTKSAEGSYDFNGRTFSTLTVNSKTIHEVKADDTREFLSKYDTVMLDCDGVLWETDHVTPIPGIPQAMSVLRETGKQVLFVTNNSIPGRNFLVDKFQRYGFKGSFEEIFTVSYAAAVYLKNVAKIQGSVYAMGTPGMEMELKELGLKYHGFGQETDKPTRDNDELLAMTFHDDVDAVLVGFDEYFDYIKMYKAASYLTKESCLYVATNKLEGGVMIGPNRRQPITAAMVQAVSVAAKREPTLVGKPDTHMYQCIQAMYPNIDKSRTLMVGDSVKADIGFAKEIGVDSALVLSGGSSLASVQDNPGLEPDFLLQSLAVLGSS